jgi:hypothetical protein
VRDVISPAKTERAAASSSTWEGCGSCLLANSMISFFEVRASRAPIANFSLFKIQAGHRSTLQTTQKMVGCDVTLAFALLNVSRLACGPNLQFCYFCSLVAVVG